ncbi:MAG: MgtC/SapB family protein [bacterium]|nr:MgtC/SapB family protein [bacterium]
MTGAEQFADTTIIMFAKLVLAMVLGGIIGTERAVMARQAAGTRTFGLVALGACLFVITSNYVDIAYLGVVNFDPMRVAASIVMGVGFIGGGLIIFKAEALHGITTAAGLWIVAAVGIAVGYGLYGIAIFSTVLVLLIFTGMWYLENRFKHWFTDHKPEIEKNNEDNSS